MARRGGGGVPGHKGGNDRTLAVNAKRGQAQREAWKDRIQPGKLLAKLEAHTNGKIQLSPSQIKRPEVLLDRLVPRLSSIEQVDVNEMDALRGRTSWAVSRRCSSQTQPCYRSLWLCRLERRRRRPRT